MNLSILLIFLKNQFLHKEKLLNCWDDDDEADVGDDDDHGGDTDEVCVVSSVESDINTGAPDSLGGLLTVWQGSSRAAHVMT